MREFLFHIVTCVFTNAKFELNHNVRTVLSRERWERKQNSREKEAKEPVCIYLVDPESTSKAENNIRPIEEDELKENMKGEGQALFQLKEG